MRQRGVPGQGEAPAEGSVTTRLDAAEAKGPEQCVEQESGTTLLGSILHALSFFLFAVGGLLLQAALTQGLQAASLSVLGSTIVWGESFHQVRALTPCCIVLSVCVCVESPLSSLPDDTMRRTEFELTWVWCCGCECSMAGGTKCEDPSGDALMRERCREACLHLARQGVCPSA